jgi:hypothetical protein
MSQKRKATVSGEMIGFETDSSTLTELTNSDCDSQYEPPSTQEEDDDSQSDLPDKKLLLPSQSGVSLGGVPKATADPALPSSGPKKARTSKAPTKAIKKKAAKQEKPSQQSEYPKLGLREYPVPHPKGECPPAPTTAEWAQLTEHIKDSYYRRCIDR